MFDINKRKRLDSPKIKDLIYVLEKLDPKSNVTIDGLENFFIHVTEDNNHTGIDVSDLDEVYEEEFKSNKKKFKRRYWAEYLKPEKCSEDYISRERCLKLLSLIIDRLEPEYLIALGFTKEEIKYIKENNNV